MEYSTYLSMDFWIRYFQTYRTYVIGVAVAASLIIGSTVYWFMAKSKQEELACATLTELMQEAGRARQNGELWSELEVSARTAYAQYKSTHMAPYFLAVQAESYVQQGKSQEAFATMNDMMSKLSASSHLYSAYAIKQARMLLDSDDEGQKNEGVQKLTALAENTANQLRDEAYYYLGNHYLHAQDKQAAQKAFNNVIEVMASKQSDYPSVWVPLAHAKLQEIS